MKFKQICPESLWKVGLNFQVLLIVFFSLFLGANYKGKVGMHFTYKKSVPLLVGDGLWVPSVHRGKDLVRIHQDRCLQNGGDLPQFFNP